MNKTRAKKIICLIDEVSELIEKVKVIRNEEETFFDNLSNPDSKRYEISRDAICDLDSALVNLEDAIDCLDDAASGIEID